jgi:dihydrofolate reductase
MPSEEEEVEAGTSLIMLPVELTLIVASTRTMGIGRAGTLPWTGLKKEMAYFARVTKGLRPVALSDDGDTASILLRPTRLALTNPSALL